MAFHELGNTHANFIIFMKRPVSQNEYNVIHIM